MCPASARGHVQWFLSLSSEVTLSVSCCLPRWTGCDCSASWDTFPTGRWTWRRCQSWFSGDARRETCRPSIPMDGSGSWSREAWRQATWEVSVYLVSTAFSSTSTIVSYMSSSFLYLAVFCLICRLRSVHIQCVWRVCSSSYSFSSP